MNSLYSGFLKGLRQRRAKGGSRGSLMDKVLDVAESGKRKEGLTYSDHELAFMGGTVTEGGSDTTASVITAFVQAMIVWPEVQKKAQAQIDSVVGEDRSPNWGDYVRLPYVAQCVKESMRWRPVVPLPLPRVLAEDDWINGKLLPKGTTVIMNSWGMQHDPTRFPGPDLFDPDHFIGVTKLANELAIGDPEDRDHYGYGAGRRICPGIHLAERTMFLAMAKILWAFDVSPGKDRAGKIVLPDTSPERGYCEGALICAYDFPATFKVRGKERKQTILREFEDGKSLMLKYE
jgi:cytochrome P450 family 619